MALKTEVRWTSRLEAVLQAVGENLEEVLDQWAADAVQEARANAPRKTGRLAASITMGGGRISVRRRQTGKGRKNKKTGVKTVATGVRSKGDLMKGVANKERVIWGEFPAAHLEFGTRYILARPFIYPAVVNMKRRAIRRIAREGLV